MVTVATKKDSVFGKHLKPNYPKEVENDKTIIPEERIKQELGELEEKSKALYVKTYSDAIDKLAKDIVGKEKPIEAIANYKWGLNIALSRNLLGEWLLGIGAGNEHGKEEIDLVKSGRANFANNIALFRRKEPTVGNLRNFPAEKAIRERNKKVAADVTDSEWQDIKSALMDAVKPVSAKEAPISRRQLIARINDALGAKKDAFPRRAEKIARTELTFAYNVGRLQSYRDSGLVSGVKFISILDFRRCLFCESRQGIITALDNYEELLKLMPPIHTMCRCVLSPVLKTQFDTESKERARSVPSRNILTEKAPWMVASILAAMIAPGLVKTTARQKAVNVTRGITSTATAVAAAKSKAKPAVIPVEPKAPVPSSDPAIMLSGTVDLQTATYAELRSVLPASIKDQTIHDIIKYRDLNTITSVDDLRDVVGVGGSNLQPFQVLGSQNQIFAFIDPRVNQSGLVLWAKSANVLTKAEAMKVHKIVTTKEIRNIPQLEEAFQKAGLQKDLVKKLQRLAEVEKERQLEALRQAQQQQGGAIVKVAGKGSAIARTKPIVSKQKPQYQQQSRGRRLSVIDSTLSDIESQISLLNDRTRLKVSEATKARGLQDTVNESAGALGRAKTISEELIGEIKPYNAQVTNLNSRVKDLEDKLAGLLNPGVTDYFGVRGRIIDDVRREINSIRGQINKVNRFANLETRAAEARAKALRQGQKHVKKAMPDYSRIQSSIESQLEDVAARISVESLRARGRRTVAISALRARYRSLVAQLENVASIRKTPLAESISDKKTITQYLGEAKKKAKNLSNRLGRLEERIAKLPTKPSQLSDRVREAYRKMPTTLTRTTNYKAPVRTAPGSQGRQARLVKSSRRQRQSSIDGKLEAIKTNVSEAVTQADNEFFRTKNWKRQPIKKQIDTRVDRYQQQLVKADQLKTELAIAAKKGSTTVLAVEESVDDLLRKIEADIYQPLGDNWFTTKGVIKADSLRATNQVKKKISNEIQNIDSKLAALKAAKNKVSSLKKEIIEIRSKAANIAISSETRQQLNDRIDNLLSEIQSVNKYEVGAKYFNSNVSKYRQELNEILSGKSSLTNSQIKNKLDRFLTKIEDLESSLTLASNAGTVSSLTQAKARLQEQAARVEKFPKRVKDLPESARIEWEEIRGLRDNTRKAKQKLDRSVSSFQSEAKSQGGKLVKLTEEIDSAVADMETLVTGDSTSQVSLYRQRLQDAIKDQKERVKIAIADLDENAKLLRLANDTERGLELVYADLKRVYNSDTPGLDFLKGRPFPVGLDEAVEVKRQVVKFLEKRGAKLVKKVKAITDENPALQLTRYKKAVVDGQIKSLEDLADAIAKQKPLAEDVQKKLKAVFDADPAYHFSLKPNKIVEKIQQSAVDQTTGINKQLVRLKEIQSELVGDLETKFTYGVRDKKIIELRNSIPVETTKPSVYLNRQGIDDQLVKYFEEVEQLAKTRRPQLEEVGLFLKSKRIKLYGKNSISENLKTNSPLTPGQQKAFEALSKQQQEFLTEASRTGVIDLYDDLYKKSVVKGLLEEDDIEEVSSLLSKLGLTDSRKIKRKSAITKKFEEVNQSLNALKRMGYKDLGVEITSESATLKGLVDAGYDPMTIDLAEEAHRFISKTQPPRSVTARKEWDKLRKSLGIAQDGTAVPSKDSIIAGLADGTIPLDDLKDITYNDLLQAIALNRQSRYEINNRLNAFNFTRAIQNYIYLTGTVGS